MLLWLKKKDLVLDVGLNFIISMLLFVSSLYNPCVIYLDSFIFIAGRIEVKKKRRKADITLVSGLYGIYLHSFPHHNSQDHPLFVYRRDIRIPEPITIRPANEV